MVDVSEVGVFAVLMFALLMFALLMFDVDDDTPSRTESTKKSCIGGL